MSFFVGWSLGRLRSWMDQSQWDSSKSVGECFSERQTCLDTIPSMVLCWQEPLSLMKFAKHLQKSSHPEQISIQLEIFSTHKLEQHPALMQVTTAYGKHGKQNI